MIVEDNQCVVAELERRAVEVGYVGWCVEVEGGWYVDFEIDRGVIEGDWGVADGADWCVIVEVGYSGEEEEVIDCSVGGEVH